MVKKILIYLNKYRKEFKVDTCLRKAHFIAQVGAETLFKSILESGSYKYISSPEKYFSTNQLIDDTILNSLESKLSQIFKITDGNNKILIKTNAELKQIIKAQQVTADIRQLYAQRKKDRTTYLEDEILKTYSITRKNEKGEDIDLERNIVLLKRGNAFPIEFLSRFYADRNGSKGGELSREGFMFCGRGVKQLTGRGNYEAFSKFRKKYPFPDDPKGYIDFTKITDKESLKGNFELLSDEENVIYAVQSALWYFQKGNQSGTGKYTVEWADEDNVQFTTKTINGGYNGLEKRNDFTKKARGDSGFKVFQHYLQIHKNGSKEQKEKVLKQLEYLNESRVEEKVELRDDNAEQLIKRLKDKPIKKLKSKGIPIILNKETLIFKMEYVK
ncbi:hypothetical protein BZG01_21035 [Labilibaculum manganireducens]|uniref:Glycoside hydrolase family 19 catalytic domain-containing protein n=1 Tax=Labilibaculum manganireducens TaxID=1940525 RepID=A0A2N3HQT2_9BACT|nr:hypothetical protein [Labilibaculum manganireducens]PKQ60399.1 hypothetical protein BZG01_21035 [Labilibaculum manganireducens]